MVFLLLFELVLSFTVSECFSESLGCHWTSCLAFRLPKNNNPPCGTDTRKIQITQGCYTNNVIKGNKHFCCSSTRNGKIIYKKCEKPKEKFWWPNDKGNWIEVTINCPFAPPSEQFMQNSNVEFFLYTQNNNNTKDYDQLYIDDVESLEESRFIKNAPVKVIAHGYLGNVEVQTVPELRQYYLQLDPNVNIIAVNWSRIASISQLLIPCYNLSAELTRFVGKRSALLLKFLVEQEVASLKDIHVMGQSLGAHISGFTGKRFFDYTGKKIPRVSGFDPAGPSFRNNKPSERIDRSDADFVDILHTAISDLDYIPGFGQSIELGMTKPIGHVDFYPNKGGYQPGCKLEPFPISNPVCSHRRAYMFYAESIFPPSNKVFRGIRCRDVNEAINGSCNGPETTLMGACTDINNSSAESIIYYLRTNAESPYALDERKMADNSYCPIP